MKNEKKLRIAIIGCGNIFTMHSTSVSISERAEIVCVCDEKIEKCRAAGEYYNVPYYVDYKKMIDCEKFDVVHICTPHYLHTTMARYALEHGIHVLSEKPMAIDYEDALKTVVLAESKQLKYGVIFQCRYNEPAIWVKKYIESGELGKIKSARVVLTWDRAEEYYRNSEWKGTIDKEGGGVVIDQGIHSLDLVNWFINAELETVDVRMSNHFHNRINVEDSAEGFIQYSNNVRLLFWVTNNYCKDEPIEIRLYCEGGTVVLSYDDAIINMNDGRKICVEQSKADIVDYKGRKECWGRAHKIQIEQFYKSVLGEEELEISGREALKIQYLIEQIYRSAIYGKK